MKARKQHDKKFLLSNTTQRGGKSIHTQRYLLYYFFSVTNPVKQFQLEINLLACRQCG